MAIFFRGDGPGSHWHVNDPRLSGFIPHFPGALPSDSRLLTHIACASTRSPYISFSRSFGVAQAYALVGPGGMATRSTPGYVWEIEISDDKGCRVLDPVVEIARALPHPCEELSYQHDGSPRFLLGIVDPIHLGHATREWRVRPPGSGGTLRTPNLSVPLEAMVRALRDAEVLVQGNVPAAFVRNRHEVNRQ